MSKPIFKKENLLYERAEKEGYWTFIPRYHPETRELIVNATSREIIELCDGTRTLEEIEQTMCKRYPQVGEDTINRDVRITVARFSRVGMVEWVGENPFLYRRAEPINDEYSLVVGQEDDFRKIEAFLQQYIISKSDDEVPEGYVAYKSPLLKSIEYSALALRQKLFSYAEEYFLLVKRSEIVGLVVIEPTILVPTSLSATLKLVIAPSEYAWRLLEYAQTVYPYLAIRDVTQLRVYERTQMPLSEKVRVLLAGAGYRDGIVLTNELGFGDDLKVWSRNYDREYIEEVNKTKGGKHG